MTRESVSRLMVILIILVIYRWICFVDFDTYPLLLSVSYSLVGAWRYQAGSDNLFRKCTDIRDDSYEYCTQWYRRYPHPETWTSTIPQWKLVYAALYARDSALYHYARRCQAQTLDAAKTCESFPRTIF